MLAVLGIIASPRKLGNCEIMVKEIARAIQVPHELHLLRLTDFSIQYCKACYRCLSGSEKCPIEDDLYLILEKIKIADVVIVASPAYFLGPHSSMKRFIDRGLSFYAYINHFWKKPAVGVAIAGIKGKEGHTLLGVENFLKMIFSDIKSSRVIYGALPGEIMLDETCKESARHLAEDLFSQNNQKEKETPHCSLCGGETFRFLSASKVRCSLCSNEGMIDFESATPVISIKKGSHEFLLKKEDALAHKAWLLQMKDRFLRHKRSLKKIALEYRRDGEWVQNECAVKKG